MQPILEWDAGMAFILYKIGTIAPWVEVLVVAIGMHITFAVAAIGSLWLIYLALRRDHRLKDLLLAVGAAIVARFVLTEALQKLIARERPFETLGLDPLIKQFDFSFPSGHATFFFGLAMGLYLVDRRLGTGAFALAIAISIGRMMAGVHYPLDIAAGAVVGIAAATIAFRVFRRR